jgi:hypothetical protein
VTENENETENDSRRETANERPRRRRLAPLALVAAAAAAYLVLGPKVPKDQTVHVVLGDASPRVTEVDVRYAPAGEQDFAREASFRYAEGAAPRIVTHSPRLADGEYAVEIELHTQKGHANVARRVKLEGDPVSIDVRNNVP